jgi:hypothetical protein
VRDARVKEGVDDDDDDDDPQVVEVRESIPTWRAFARPGTLAPAAA